MQNGSYASNKWSMHIINRCHMPVSPSRLLCVNVCVPGCPRMRYGLLRPPKRVPPFLPFYCNNWGWRDSEGLPLPYGCIPAIVCIPLANSNHAVDCYIIFDIIIEHLLPRSPDFAIPTFMQYGTCGSNKSPVPVTPQRHTFQWTIWLLCKRVFNWWAA